MTHGAFVEFEWLQFTGLFLCLLSVEGIFIKSLPYFLEEVLDLFKPYRKVSEGPTTAICCSVIISSPCELLLLPQVISWSWP